MPVMLSLNNEQMDVYNQAIKGQSVIPVESRGTIQLTRENWEAVREAVSNLRDRKYKVKTKKVEHLEICFYAQEIMTKIDFLSGEFSVPVPTPSNDDTIGIVTDPVDESTNDADID